MKKIAYAFLALTFLFTACEGPQGPSGFDGEDGGLIVSSAFEIEIDFNNENDFEFIEAYGFEVFPSDVTLVYILWDTIDGQNVWRLMPQNVVFDDGSILTYNFDFTQEDVRFFLDGTTNLLTLDNVWTQDQVFRVVVVPADNVDGIDTSNLNLIMGVNNIESFELR